MAELKTKLEGRKYPVVIEDPSFEQVLEARHGPECP
jgi:hypothetical protein